MSGGFNNKGNNGNGLTAAEQLLVQTIEATGYLSPATGQYKVFYTVGFTDADYLTTNYASHTATIQAAVSAAHAVGGGTIFIKPGTYTLTGHIVIYDNIEILGTPVTIITRGSSTGFEALFVNQYYVGSSSAYNINIKIHDLVFDGGGDTNSYSQFKHAIGIYGVHDAEVYNVRFVNLSGDGIYVSSTSQSYTNTFYRATNVRIYGNHFEGTQQNRNGISVIDAENVTISGNTFYKMTSSVQPGAIDLEPNFTDQKIRNVTISGNIFEQSGNRGVQFYNIYSAAGTFDGLTITGNTFNDNTLFDIYGLSWANVTISGNVHRTSLSRAIEVDGTSTLTISGESIFFPQSSAIHIVHGGAGVNIVGNTIISPGGHGIWLDDVDNPNVTGNTIRSWGVASAIYAAVYGENGVASANISGNVFDDVAGTHYGIKSADTSSGWFIGQNQIVNAATKYSLVGTNYIFDQNSVNVGISTKFAKVGGKIKEFYTDVGNVGTGEDDLYSYTTEASILSVNGDMLELDFGGTYVSSGTATREIKLWFGGTAIFDTGALTLSLSSAWNIYGVIIRVSATVVRYTISLTTQGAALSAYTASGELTGLTLSNTNVLKLTGEAAGVGAATNDIVAKIGAVRWYPVSV